MVNNCKMIDLADYGRKWLERIEKEREERKAREGKDGPGQPSDRR